jgi:sarcosine oxidase, subunit beta
METLSADVVVIGGGATGTSIAYHLAEVGVTDVVLVERNELGSGSTSKSAGGIRAQFADELNIQIALRSIAEFERFEERFEVPIDFRQVGYLFLLDDENDVQRFRRALELQHVYGVPSEELPVEEAVTLVPQIHADGLLHAFYCALDGYATPEAVVRGYAGAGVARGLRIRQGDAVVAIEREGERIRAVETASARIATDTVVCAAGAWSRDVAALCGVDLPVKGEPRWLHFSPHNGGIPDSCPLTVDFSSGFYFHREGPGLVFGGREQTLEALAEPAIRRLPVIEGLEIQASWWGYYEVSPDNNAIVGETESPSRFLYATGFSGHGFQQSPAVGEYVAALIAGTEPVLDLSPFSLDRFASGLAREEAFVI